MFDVQAFVAGRRYRAQRMRSQGRWLWFSGAVIDWVAFPCFLVGGLVRAGLEYAPAVHQRPMLIDIPKVMANIANALHELIEQYLGLFWDIILAVSPHPRFENPLPLVSWIGWGMWIACLAALGRSMFTLSQKRRTSAQRIEEKLEDAEHSLLDIQDRQQRQNNQVGDVVGDGNTIHQVNTIRQIFREEKQESVVNKWLVGTVVGLTVTIISKFVHLS